MKVLLFNGSPRPNGGTFTILNAVAKTLNEHGLDTEILQIGNRPIQDCIACGACVGKGQCIFNDDCVNEWLAKIKTADAFVFGTPVYYAHPSGRLLSIMDRLFYAGSGYFAHKPAAVVASARRAGTTATLDVVQKHCLMAQMPVVASTYWNMVFGNTAAEKQQDAEGLQTMRNLAHNLAWLLQCIDAGRQSGITPPAPAPKVRTNYIR